MHGVSNDGLCHVAISYDVGFIVCPKAWAIFFASKSQSQNGRTQVVHANSNCQQCIRINVQQYTWPTSQYMEITWYYPELPECQEIKRMCKPRISGPFTDFSNGPGNDATLLPPSLPSSHMTPCDWYHTLHEVNIVEGSITQWVHTCSGGSSTG